MYGEWKYDCHKHMRVVYESGLIKYFDILVKCQREV